MKKLEPSLGLLSVISISISAMLGSGLFVLPGIAFTKAGSFVWMAYLIASIGVIPASLSKAELASAMPTSGGTYVYLERTFGPLVGTIAGLGLWLSLLLKAGLALMGFGAYLEILAHVDLHLTSLILLGLIVALNVVGTGKVSKALFWITLTTILIITLLQLSSIPFAIQKDLPVSLFNMSGILEATSMVFVSYAGVTKVAAIAEEIKSPEVNLPRGIFLSLLIVTILYCGVTYTLSKLFPLEILNQNLRPIYDQAVFIGGPSVGHILAIIAVLCMTSMANAGLLASSRFPFAMSRDHLMPNRFGRLHKSFLTPTWSILASGVIIGLAITFFKIEFIAKLASAFILMIYVSENIAVIILREMRVQWYQPKYKAPFYPLTQVFGIGAGIALLSYIGPKIIMQCLLSIVLPSLFFYFFYGRKYSSRLGVLGIRLPRKELTQTSYSVEDKPSHVSITSHQYHRGIPSVDLSSDAKVIVSLFGEERSPEMLIEMGAAIANKNRLEVAHMTEVPEQTDLSDFFDEPTYLNSLRRRVLAMAMDHQIPVTFDPIVCHDIIKTTFTLSARLHCEWLMVEYGGRTSGAFTLHNPVGWLRDHLDCHLGIFRDAGVRYVRKILIILKDLKSDQFVIETVEELCKVFNADMTLLKYIGPFINDEHFLEKEKNLEEFKTNYVDSKLKADPEIKLPKMSTKIVAGDDISETLIRVTSEYDLLVFSLDEFSTKAWHKRFFGGTDDKLTQKAHCSVLKIRPSKNYFLKHESSEAPGGEAE